MPFNSKSSTDLDFAEPLKYPTGLHAIKPIVLDVTTLPVSPGAINRIRRGTPVTAAANGKHKVYSGSGTVDGILAIDVDLAVVAGATVGATNADEPASAFYQGCIFATQGVVGFTLYQTAILAGLGTSGTNGTNRFE